VVNLVSRSNEQVVFLYSCIKASPPPDLIVKSSYNLHEGFFVCSRYSQVLVRNEPLKYSV